VKGNEPNVVVDGMIGAEKPRFVINPEGIKGVVAPIFGIAMDVLSIIPTFKGKNADGCSRILTEAERSAWIQADGSNWDSTQYS